MFYYSIPINEEIDELKDAKVLLKGKLPLYFALKTDMVDNIYITDYKNDNLYIGEVVVDYTDKMYNIFIFDEMPLGNMAIELLDQMQDQDLLQQQSRLQFGVYDEEDLSSFGILTLRVGILGELQEDFYSAYFLGTTIRPYGYDKENYYKKNYTDEELSMSDADLITRDQPFFARLFSRLFGRK